MVELKLLEVNIEPWLLLEDEEELIRELELLEKLEVAAVDYTMVMLITRVRLGYTELE